MVKEPKRALTALIPLCKYFDAVNISIWQIIILSSAVKHRCATAAAGQTAAAAARQLSEFLSDVWPAN